MSRLSIVLTLLGLCAIVSVSLARKPELLGNDHQRLKRQVEDPVEPVESDDEDVDADTEADRSHHWINCDWLKTPRLSCYDCNTRIICKPSGGKLKYCGRYCNNGLCSDTPSDSCRNA